MAVTIEKVEKATEELVVAFRWLLPQLSSTAKPLDFAALERVLSCPANTLLVARDGGKISGALTLVVFPIPTGVRAWIEDVVVDEAARGSGIGTELTRKALELAKDMGVRTVDLTSRPNRVAANRLYRRLGFKQRESLLYRYLFGE